MSFDVKPRLATMQDAELLYAWRNDPVTRANSRQTGPMDLANHKAWLEKSLQIAGRKIFIIENAGTPVATVRCDWSSEVCELSWTVAPEKRRKGYATLAVKAVMELFPEATFRAEIKAGNVASIKVSVRAGVPYVLV